MLTISVCELVLNSSSAIGRIRRFWAIASFRRSKYCEYSYDLRVFPWRPAHNLCKPHPTYSKIFLTVKVISATVYAGSPRVNHGCLRQTWSYVTYFASQVTILSEMDRLYCNWLEIQVYLNDSKRLLFNLKLLGIHFDSSAVILALGSVTLNSNLVKQYMTSLSNALSSTCVALSSYILVLDLWALRKLSKR